MKTPRGQVTGVHLLGDPRVRPAVHTSAYWTQAERDRFVALGIGPAQPTLFDVEAQ